MKRLVRKAAGLGRDYFTPSDVQVNAGIAGAVMTCINPDKIAHEDEEYVGTYTELESIEELGGADYLIMDDTFEEFEELPDQDFFANFEVIIDIQRVEVRPEYRGTNAVWLMMDGIVDQVFMSYINQYGVDKVVFCSTFENEKFSQTLPQYFQQKIPGIQFKVY